LDEATVAAARQAAGPQGCACRAPFDKRYLAGLLRELEAKRPAAIGIDLLTDEWTSAAERREFLGALKHISTPIVMAGGDPPDGFSAPNVA
jgi:CHASE2 domain-containing sensor protein